MKSEYIGQTNKHEACISDFKFISMVTIIFNSCKIGDIIKVLVA